MNVQSMPVEHVLTEQARRVVELACLAPSIHNTQPWLWRIDGDRLTLRADRSRQLPVADPQGRNLMISCGTALHHVQVAAAGLGLAAEVTRLPDPDDEDLLAVIDLSPGHRTPAAVDRLAALEQRCTDRRRFTSWPVPVERLDRLAAAGEDWGAEVLPLTDVTSRFRVELLVSRAMTRQEADERYAAEEGLWIDHSREDGIPSGAVPRVDYYPRNRRARFGHGLYPDAHQELVESSDGLLAICTGSDTPLAWLRAGETLSAVWLQATYDGLSVVPLSQVIEVEETRLALYHEVFRSMNAPQILVRIGWQAIGRSTLPRTPRRPVDSVLA
ncbi:Acg family FMN-binding oxidoreductase [Nocardioides ferulae]|uniref:Acg family FMN-binding oxidoreductase n=1 Tax=Nocardioides ferulae TaxID=2340821 RepID=UPI000EAD3272|nr:NAD(P)H nitroreductase [Nocardioides ferulae]